MCNVNEIDDMNIIGGMHWVILDKYLLLDEMCIGLIVSVDKKWHIMHWTFWSIEYQANIG